MDLIAKRFEQQRETWIKNVMKIQGLSREEAEKMFDKLMPYPQNLATITPKA
jgi:hypothetical protein